MEYTQYLQIMEEKMKNYFDLEHKWKMEDETFELFAKYTMRNEKYMASKKIPIYAFENHEYCIFKYFNTVEEERIIAFTEYLKKAIDHLVSRDSEHMSSIITGVIMIEQCNDGIKEYVRKFKYYKSFALGLRGWVHIRLVLIDLSTGKIITSPRGKEVQEFYQVND